MGGDHKVCGGYRVFDFVRLFDYYTAKDLKVEEDAYRHLYTT